MENRTSLTYRSLLESAMSMYTLPQACPRGCRLRLPEGAQAAIL